MSRILKALKQLEARPTGAAEEVASAQDTALPPIAAESGEQAPRAPRRKQSAAIKRRVTSVDDLPDASESALATAEQIEELLSSLAPSVIECWDERGSAGILLVESPASEPGAMLLVNDQLPALMEVALPPELARPTQPESLLSLSPAVIECWDNRARDVQFVEPPTSGNSESVLINDQLPQVIELAPVVAAQPSTEAVAPPEPAPVRTARSDLLLSLLPGVIECWDNRSRDVQLVEPPTGESSATVLVNDQLPTLVEVAAPTEPARPSRSELLLSLLPGVVECWDDRSRDVQFVEPASNGPSESVLVNDQLPALVELPAASHASSEVELSFAPITKPRRLSRDRPRKTSRVTTTRQQEIVQREQQIRRAVRGPRELSLARPTAWETTIRHELDDAQQTASLTELLLRWQHEHAGEQVRSLQLVSLAQPHLAAEVALRAAALLTRESSTAVLLIDADPEAALSRRLGITGQHGFSDLLAPQDAHGETIHPTSFARVHLLPRGKAIWPVGATAERVGGLLQELSQSYAWLLVVAGDTNAPAIVPLSRACVGTYVVAPLQETDRAIAAARLATLQQASARVLGAIVSQ